MKLHVAFSILFIGFSGCALANQLPLSEVSEDAAPHSRGMTAQNPQPPSVLSVFLYLPLTDDASWSSIMAQSQLTVTPTATYTVRAIRATGWNSIDGSCTDQYGTPYNIDNGAGNTVSLTNGHAYRSTDASNAALKNASVSVFHPRYDSTLQLLDNNLNPIGASVCISGVGGACTDATNCGWSTSRTWTP